MLEWFFKLKAIWSSLSPSCLLFLPVFIYDLEFELVNDSMKLWVMYLDLEYVSLFSLTPCLWRGGGGGIKNLNKYFLCILSVYSDSPCEKGGGGGGNVFFLPLVDPDLGSGRDLRSSKEASKWVWNDPIHHSKRLEHQIWRFPQLWKIMILPLDS